MGVKLPMLDCRQCGARFEPELRWVEHEAGRHLGAYCQHCGAWIKWVPQEAPWTGLPPNPAGAHITMQESLF